MRIQHNLDAMNTYRQNRQMQMQMQRPSPGRNLEKRSSGHSIDRINGASTLGASAGLVTKSTQVAGGNMDVARDQEALAFDAAIRTEQHASLATAVTGTRFTEQEDFAAERFAVLSLSHF